MDWESGSMGTSVSTVTKDEILNNSEAPQSRFSPRLKEKVHVFCYKFALDIYKAF